MLTRRLNSRLRSEIQVLDHANCANKPDPIFIVPGFQTIPKLEVSATGPKIKCGVNEKDFSVAEAPTVLPKNSRAFSQAWLRGIRQKLQ